MVPTNTGIFFRGLKLCRDLGIQKENSGVTMHFSEIIKLQFGKKRHTLLCILLVLRIIVASLSLKNAWLPLISFLDFISPCLDLLSPHSLKPHKYFFICRHRPQAKGPEKDAKFALQALCVNIHAVQQYNRDFKKNKHF